MKYNAYRVKQIHAKELQAVLNEEGWALVEVFQSDGEYFVAIQIKTECAECFTTTGTPETGPVTFSETHPAIPKPSLWPAWTRNDWRP